MDQGWVYVLYNPSIPGLVKIGQTSRLPADRAIELSRATGVATPFILVFEQAFADCVSAEQRIHAILDQCGMRSASNREFFNGSIPDIIRLVLQYAAETGDGAPLQEQLSGQDLLLRGDDHLFGEGDTLQDLREAFRCYQVAAARGSPVAFERLGAIVALVQGDARGGKGRAMGYLKEGARRGNYYCYCEMAMIAAEEGHLVNFIKAWDLFFNRRATAFLSEAESGTNRYSNALQRYVVACFTAGVTPGHVSELAAEAEGLVGILGAALDKVWDLPDARRSLLLALRWAYRTLLQQPYPGDRARSQLSWVRSWLGRRRFAPA